MAIIGLGTTLEVNDGVSNAFAPFLYVKELSTPKSQLNYVDSTYLNQSDNYRKYVGGMIEPGDMEFTIQYVAADYTRVFALRGVSHNWKITFPDSSTVTFGGILQFGEMPVTVDGIMETKCSVRVSGAVTFTP